VGVQEIDGTHLFRVGWEDICTRFHRRNPTTLEACLESDARFTADMVGDGPRRSSAYQCSNGLWDVAFPLVVDGEHIATAFMGQFFYDDDTVDVEAFRARAAEAGFDTEAYLEALGRVPVVTRKHVDRTARLLSDLVALLGEMGLAQLRWNQDHAALLESEQRLRLANEATNDVVWDLDIPNDSQRWIATGETVFGWSDVLEDPVSEEWWAERVHPNDGARVHENYQRLIDEPEATNWTEEYRFRKADGTYALVLDRAHVVRDGAGVAQRMIGAMLDVTERRAAEEELRQSREQYETFINATDDMAFLKDDELRYIIVNTANAAFFGRGVEEIVGRTDAELMPAGAAAACRASDMLAVSTVGVVVTTERQGTRVYESRKFPVALADGRTGIGGYVRDVTEQRHAEAEIRRLATDLERRVDQRTAQLEATNRELESFAYSISHDLRSPLRALDGFSEILLQDYSETLDDAGRDYLRRIKGAANHMAGLMDGLLQLSRLNRDGLDFTDVDLSALAGSFVAELRERDPARDVVVDIAPGLVARADPKLMRVVLENLLGNAWKFTARHEKARIEFGADQTDGGTTFYVRDDGAGFDMRYAKNLFGAFQRLHTPDQFEGTGIGLATVQRVVHRHGGTVWAEGEVEKGATFWFTLEPPDAA
jgi:PAS domain S-box-containing protein